MSDDDRTVDADPATLDTIRRLAARAEANAGRAANGEIDHGDQDDRAAREVQADHTIDADPGTLDQIRRLAQGAAPRASSDAAPYPSRPLDNPAAPRSLDELDVPSARKVPPPPPARSLSEGPWQPPARSMRPTDEDRRTDDGTRKWRLATAAMAVLVVALLAWMLLVGESDPADGPTGTTVPAGTPITGPPGEGGSGG